MELSPLSPAESCCSRHLYALGSTALWLQLYVPQAAAVAYKMGLRVHLSSVFDVLNRSVGGQLKCTSLWPTGCFMMCSCTQCTPLSSTETILLDIAYSSCPAHPTNCFLVKSLIFCRLSLIQGVSYMCSAPLAPAQFFQHLPRHSTPNFLPQTVLGPCAELH